MPQFYAMWSLDLISFNGCFRFSFSAVDGGMLSFEDTAAVFRFLALTDIQIPRVLEIRAHVYKSLDSTACIPFHAFINALYALRVMDEEGIAQEVFEEFGRQDVQLPPV